jgi:SAM-dependent methyltransferase
MWVIQNGYEYEQFSLEEKSIIARLKRRLSSDYRSKSSIKAFNDIFINNNIREDVIFLSIGGGPTRPCPKMINLNIGPFQNVDIVGDAHQLPYADNSVDAIYCEAVIEHLYNPVKAVNEMYRILKKDGGVFVVTPFLQPYHGYPSHYQNYTLTGHEYL